MDPQAVIEVFRRNLTEHYFDLTGRVRRQEFWYFVLACFVVYIAAAIVDAIIGTRILMPLLALALLLPMTGLGARRLQDIGRDGSLIWVWTFASLAMQLISFLTVISGPTGFFYFFLTFGWLISLISLVALVVSIALIYFWVQPGDAGPNAYGPDPKAGAAPTSA